MHFGAIKTTEFTDDNGSTVSTEVKYHSGMKAKPVRRYYEIKHKVKDQKEEHEEYLRFSEDIKTDQAKLDPAWKIEHTKQGNEQGYYLVISCYTILEY